jgi:predicted phosphodiesterase
MRIAVISDIHEDVVNLGSALRMIEREKCDEIICLGDILGYPFLRGRYPQKRDFRECIKLIRQNCSIVVKGNHDLFHLKRLPQFYKGFEFPPDWFGLSEEQHTIISKGRVWNYSDDLAIDLSENETEYLDSLPEFAFKDIGGKKILLSHSLYPNFSSYVSFSRYNSDTLKEHFNFMKENSSNLSLCGHMHLEGLGVANEPGGSLLSRLFPGFIYYPYGVKKIKQKPCCVTIPAIADNGQENGFAVIDVSEKCNYNDYYINSLSLNSNRRFNL